MNKQIVKNNWWTEKRGETKKILFEKLKQSSSMQTTDIRKIVINSCVKGGTTNGEQQLKKTNEAVMRISQGQKPAVTKAKKSIIGFKIREGMEIGCKVTLRRSRIWNFLFELINVNFPLISNFKGFSEKKFDKSGNYSLGIGDLNIFPSVPFDLTFKNQGIQITFVFKSDCMKENKYFLELLGFPFARKK